MECSQCNDILVAPCNIKKNLCDICDFIDKLEIAYNDEDKKLMLFHCITRDQFDKLYKEYDDKIFEKFNKQHLN